MLPEILSAVGSIAGGIMGNRSAKKAAEKNFQQQKQFAQNSIQWKAKDAEKAGISKVFAMGAPTASFTPASVGGNFDFLGSAGQNIGRAITASQTPQSQAGAIPRAAQAVQLEGMQLDNEFKKAQIASLNKTLTQAGQPPGVPAVDASYGLPGQPFTVEPPVIEPKTKMDVELSGHPGVVPGNTPENLVVTTASGKRILMPAPAVQEALESMGFIAQRQSEMRNIAAPTFIDNYRPVQFREGASPGYYHTYNPLTGEYDRRKNRPYHNPRSR